MSQPYTILVAEDDPDLLDIAKSRLEMEGMQVIGAIDGQEAIEKAKTKHPDFIILDILMPTIDGLGALAELKNNAATKDIPVIILSNLDEAGSKEQARTIADVDYYVKSKLSMEELVSIIKRKLKIQ